MKKNLTEIIFLLDRSGSMAGLEQDTIGGFNSFVEKQCQQDGDTTVTAVLFDNHYHVLWDGVDAKEVRLTEEEYFVRGSTALLDAVGNTILAVSQRMARTNVEDRPNQLLFVITTDGMENSSREFNYDKVKRLIEQQQKINDWEFIFLGANIDAIQEAGNLGIRADQAFNYEASSEGVANMYELANEMVTEKRRSENER